VRSKARAVITGEMAHRPCQMAHPDWSLVDNDAEAAALTRSRLLAEWADQTILVIGTHFAAPNAGHVVRDSSVQICGARAASPTPAGVDAVSFGRPQRVAAP
jgi:hypothetical protein